MDKIKSENYYLIESELGRGGMATVYLARDQMFDTNVAIKVLNKEFVHNENIRKRFLAEAKNMFKMSHSNIVKVTDLIVENDTVAFVMEYIEGETLKEYLERKGKLKDDEIKTIFSQILEAVGYAHKKGLVHRDIKPSNIIIDSEYLIKLLDFGIAKTLDSSSVEYDQTTAELRLGTTRYMSPEQLKSSKDLGPASDIYSIGVLLWQMIMGIKPYSAEAEVEIPLKILGQPLLSTNTKWDELIQSATLKSIDDRISNCQDFKAQFKELFRMDKTDEDATVVDFEELKHHAIGGLSFMTQNLNTDKFNNGELIREAKSIKEWRLACEQQIPAWSYIDINGLKQRVYNWYAVIDVRGIAPVGWHIPSVEEFRVLLSNFTSADELNIGKSIYRYKYGDFVEGDSMFWMNNDFDIDQAYCFAFSDDCIEPFKDHKGCGHFIRCIRDY
jgi:serine/threonine protein kinase